jgi:hypothetical protein
MACHGLLTSSFRILISFSLPHALFSRCRWPGRRKRSNIGFALDSCVSGRSTFLHLYVLGTFIPLFVSPDRGNGIDNRVLYWKSFSSCVYASILIYPSSVDMEVSSCSPEGDSKSSDDADSEWRKEGNKRKRSPWLLDCNRRWAAGVLLASSCGVLWTCRRARFFAHLIHDSGSS